MAILTLVASVAILSFLGTVVVLVVQMVPDFSQETPLSCVAWKVYFSDDPNDYVIIIATTESVARYRGRIHTGRNPVKAELKKD